ncbi:DUF86 domain-containing protein [Neorhizobium lilium]|uniref:DUF86 domain-containing protein n=1 Tax=Neorhizobium lilium TaxID=2503024 RepID=A0A444LGZ7_9HYPH|nr:DUF86 domain-containing protein [Neorhizobium lilium]
MRDIVENGTSVLDYTKDLDFEGYISNRLVCDATERCLARVSEAAVKLDTLAEELFPNHDWLAMRHLGNVLRHDYSGVMDSVIWIIRNDRLPPLLADLETFLAQYPDDQEML